MLFFKVKNKPKPYIGSESPSERKFKNLIQKYGNRVETTFGRKIFPSGEQFVKDAKTGRVFEFTSEVKYLGTNADGYHFYLYEGSTLSETEQAHPSFVK